MLLDLRSLFEVQSIVMVVTPGVFVETGEPVTFDIGLVTSAGSFTETGESAPLNISLVTSFGSFTETGEAAPLAVGLTAAFGSFAETGEPQTFTITLVTNATTYTLTGGSSPGGGGVTAGTGQFTETGETATFDTALNTTVGLFQVLVNFPPPPPVYAPNYPREVGAGPLKPWDLSRDSKLVFRKRKRRAVPWQLPAPPLDPPILFPTPNMMVPQLGTSNEEALQLALALL